MGNLSQLLKLYRAGRWERYYQKTSLKAMTTPAVTKKELEVLQLLGNGFSSKQIAHEMHISFHTAETYRKNLLGKFEARNSAELMKKVTKIYWLE